MKPDGQTPAFGTSIWMALFESRFSEAKTKRRRFELETALRDENADGGKDDDADCRARRLIDLRIGSYSFVIECADSESEQQKAHLHP